MIPRAARIFLRECLVSVTIVVSTWLRTNIKAASVLNLNLLVTDQVIKFINEIYCNKIAIGDMPWKIIKTAKKQIAEPIANCVNSSISTDIYPDELKKADIVPVFKKKDQNNKTNYRPTSLLPLIPKIFEKVIYQQIKEFTNFKILSPKFCG